MLPGPRSTPQEAPESTGRAPELLGTVTTGLIVSAVAFLVFARSPLTAEDAAILFRYAENLAGGHGIVFNPGGTPVDGATDLLFMALLAGLHAIGLPTATAAALVNAISLGLICAFVYWSWQFWAGLRPPWLLLPSALLLAGPVWVYGAQGFGTLAFAAACAGVALASETASRQPTAGVLIRLGILIVIAGLIRPEGFILGALLVAGQAWLVRSPRAMWIPGAVVLTAGLAFVAMRWSYFGYPLPNPFYKKSGGHLHPVGIKSTAALLLRGAFPLCALIFLGLIKDESRRRALFLVFVIIGWASAWLLISDEMNTAGRFQYAIVPVLLILGAPLYREYRESPHVRRSPGWHKVVCAAFAVSGIAVAATNYLLPAITTQVPALLSPATTRADSIHYRIAEVLSNHAGNGDRVLATTEAGYVAWRSGWIVRDLWGLNDQEIAHHGYLSPSQLAAFDPELIVANVPTNNLAWDSRAYAHLALPGWASMTDAVVCFANSHDYELIGHWGNTGSFVVLARSDLPDLASLRRDLAQVAVGDLSNTASNGRLPTPAICPP